MTADAAAGQRVQGRAAMMVQAGRVAGRTGGRGARRARQRRRGAGAADAGAAVMVLVQVMRAVRRRTGREMMVREVRGAGRRQRRRQR